MKYLGELILSDTVDDRDRGPYTVIESTAIDGNVADVYGEFPEESAENAKAIVDGMNEASSLRQTLVEICNIVGACTADVSLAFLTHLPGEVKARIEKERQTAVDLFDVVAEIAALVGIERSESEICRKTVTAVRELVEVRSREDCPKCGEENVLLPGDNFCPICGVKIIWPGDEEYR